jgi:hypothetical protein
MERLNKRRNPIMPSVKKESRLRVKINLKK